MSMRRKISIPSKVGVVTASVVFIYWSYVSRKQSFKNVISFINSYQSKVSNLISKDIPVILKDMNYETMTVSVLEIMASFSKDVSTIPSLLNTPTGTLSQRIGSRIDSASKKYFSSMRSKASDLSKSTIPLYVTKMMTNLDTEFRGYADNVDADELDDILKYYTGMITTMRASIERDVRGVFEKNTNDRLTRLENFISVTKIGILETYTRLVDTTKNIYVEMDFKNQIRNIVTLDIQERLIQLISRNVNYKFFEDFVAGKIDLEDKLREWFVDADEIRSGISDEIHYRVSNGHIPGMLKSNSSKIYLKRSEAIKSDKILNNAQKRELNTYAMSLFNELATNMEKSNSTDNYSSSALTGHANTYLKAILPDCRVYILGIMIEFSNVMRRSRIEGTQSCIVQFFEMRRVMDYDFFFAICQEEDYDMNRTRARFEEMYDKEMRDSRDKMISFVRMPRITFLYNDAGEFLQSLSELLFFRDDELREYLDSMTTDMQTQLADSIGPAIDAGIEEVYQEEETDSREAVMSVYSEFEANMQVFKVSYIVDEFSRSLFGEISHQSEFIMGLMGELSESFRVETTGPYTEEFFNETQKSFVTEGDIDYEGMKRYVVAHMNETGQRVLSEYHGLMDEFVVAKIDPVGKFMNDLVQDVRKTIDESPISEADKAVIAESLEIKVNDVTRLIETTKTSLRVSLDGVIQVAIKQLDIIMDTTTENFFNIAKHEIVEEFRDWVSPIFKGVYDTSIDKIRDDQMVLAKESKAIFEHHVRKLIDYEVVKRDEIKKNVIKSLEGEVERIVADYNIVSYEARRTVVRNNLKFISNKAVSELDFQRLSVLSRLKSDYNKAVSMFSMRYKKMYQEHVGKFNDKYSQELSSAYTRVSDLLGSVKDVMNILEGELRGVYTEAHREQAFEILAGPYNGLPDINMNNVCYPLGLMGIAPPEEGDLPSIMAPYLIIEPSYEEGDVLQEGEVVDQEASELLGTSTEDYHPKIVLGLSDYESWKDRIIDEEIAVIEIGMEQDLRNNTCPNRPKCDDGTYDCEEPERNCREGYILERNSHDVLCCRFDPPAAGFPYGEVGKMLGEELAWAMFTDPSGIAFMGKVVKGLGVKMGTTAMKAGKSIGMVSRLSAKVSGAVAKANAKIASKMAMKTGTKAGMKLGTKFASKLGLKAGVRIATMAGKTLLKGLAKVAVSGPLAAAMVVFDLISLALDIWDPAGYNDVQASGMIRDIRDDILKQYTDALAFEGINNPLNGDVFYNMPPEKQGSFFENLIIDWYTDKISTFMSSNEERWETMPVSEMALEYDAETSRLQALMDSDVNFIQTLINDNTENTFLVRSSTIAGTESHIVGTINDPDYDITSGIHLKVCSLTPDGVVAFNSFAVQKAEFINRLSKEPVYRLVKLDYTGNKIYKKAEIPRQYETENADDRDSRTKAFLEEATKLNTASILTGWKFVKMDPVDEFWRQYTYMKEEGLDEIPHRNKYIDAWNKLKKDQEEKYKATILALMEEEIAVTVPVGEPTASLEMIKNKRPDAPTWYSDYEELYDRNKQALDENISELMESERLALKASEESAAIILEEADKSIADKTGISIEEARVQRRDAEFTASNMDIDPEYCEFKGGYGQSSPLYSIKKICDDMGYGAYYDTNKGLCEFTREYCQRYGLTYFYNEDVGTHDCMLTNVQRGFETVFGTTITRSVNKAAKSSVKSDYLKSSIAGRVLPSVLGASGKARCVTSRKTKSPLETAARLDSLGLGCKYSIWN